MSDEREYVSILDGVEDDAPIVIIPDDDEERDYTQCSTMLLPEEEAAKPVEPEKRTVFGVIRNFWYYHKITVIVVAVLAIFIGLFISSVISKETNDLTVAVFSESAISDSDQMAIKIFLSDYATDFDGDNMRTVGSDYFVTTDDEYTIAQIEADYKNRIRCIYLTTEESFYYITSLYPDIFESYNGCDLWIPLSGTDLCAALSAQGADCSDLGISLLAKPDGDTEYYERALKLLDALSEKYPETFD